MKTNIVMIGMPASGKSTLGRILADKLSKDFLDVDLLLEKKENLPLQEIINKKGNAYFKNLEANALKELDLENTVISPGGSAVYYDDAMQYLRTIANVLYIKVPFFEIEKRMNNLKSRGIVFKEGQTLRGLYDERVSLYEKWADILIDTKGLDLDGTVSLALDFIENEGKL